MWDIQVQKHLDDQGRLNGILSSSGEQPVGPDKELQGGASSEEVAKVVKDVTEAALKALDPNASDSKSTTNLLQGKNFVPARLKLYGWPCAQA